jgi:hypothetical protein
VEDGWVAKQERRQNARTMWYAVWIIALVGLLQTAALHRVSQLPPSDVRIMVTLEDITYEWPDGSVVVVDRQTWQTWRIGADGTIRIGGK